MKLFVIPGYVVVVAVKIVCEACIVTLAVVAALASVAHKIAIEKDWIVEVAGGKKSRLAS